MFGICLKSRNKTKEGIRIIVNKDNQSETEAVVHEFLAQLNLPAHMKGYDYLCTAVTEAVQSLPHKKIPAKILYSETAKQYHTTDQCVERNIRYCLSEAWNQSDSECFRDLSSLHGRKRKPTNMAFIYAVANEIILGAER